jgi:alpha-D-ribose 1-methylphosphonate 5-phosphate C-P lyase
MNQSTLTGVTAPLATRSSATSTSTSTAIFARIPEADQTADQTEIYSIGVKWNKVRHMTREEADKLEPEWLEAYNRYFAKYEEDMTKMTEIATKIQKMIEPPQLQPKTDGQRRRDKYAGILAREAARANRKPN